MNVKLDLNLNVYESNYNVAHIIRREQQNFFVLLNLERRHRG
jgi:hypothetical protein